MGDELLETRSTRALTAMPSASRTSSWRRSSRIDQPITRRLKTSWTAGEEQEALAGLDVLEVAHPKRVRLGARESAVDEVRSRGRPHRGVVVPGPPRRPFAPRRPRSRISRATRSARRARHGRAAARHARAGRHRSAPSRYESRINPPSSRITPSRAPTARDASRRRSPGVSRRPSCRAGRRGTLRPPRRQTESGHGRSLSLMKKAAARFRISRSWRNTRFSRSSSRKGARSSVATRPGTLTTIGLVLIAPVTQRLLRHSVPERFSTPR